MSFTKKIILQRLLSFMARGVLRKYQPLVAGITGSVGKSTAKEAIALVLASAFRVRKSEGNYNNEIGVPLTILGSATGGSSWSRWLLVGFRWLSLMLLPHKYPEVLVLEMGIDHPGDMDYLLSIVTPKVGVATQISGSHLLFFGTLSNIAREKGKLITNVPEDGFAILNADDQRVLKMSERSKAKTITYGFSPEADVRADNLIFHGDLRRAEGFSFKLEYAGKSLPVRLPQVIACHHIPAVLAAVAVGVALKMNLVEVAHTLRSFKPLPGRLNMVPGRQNTYILDDTYNSSPSSTQAALKVIEEMQAARKVAILGDMLELGPEALLEHARLAPDIKQADIHLLVLVGKYMRSLHDALLDMGYARKQVLWLPDPHAALEALGQLIRPRDLILIKGSQGMRMEIIVEHLLADPLRAGELLCRQSPSWKNKMFKPPEEWTENPE